jgi:tripartite-type tricarboxylate transporter receptor subunit TctC
MKGLIGQPIIIENVSGADGSLGVGRAARAQADGYTIVLGLKDTNVLNGAFYSLPYDVLNDFAPISLLGTSPVVLFGRKTLPARGLDELIAWLKANPTKASAGIQTIGYRVRAVLFQKETNSHSCPTVAALPQCRTCWRGRSICFSMPRVSCS